MLQNNLQFLSNHGNNNVCENISKKEFIDNSKT